MFTEDLQEDYIKDKGLSYFNANQETEYSKWLEEELIEARKQLNKLRLDDVSNCEDDWGYIVVPKLKTEKNRILSRAMTWISEDAQEFGRGQDLYNELESLMDK